MTAAAIGAPAIVITGASSAIGREIARCAIDDGHPLVLLGRSESALAELVKELAAIRPDIPVHTLRVELQSDRAIAQLEALLATHNLICEVLVNSAGLGCFGPVAESNKDIQAELIDVNIKAVVALTLRFLPGMIARGRGGIINLGSITAYAPGPDMATYCASKAFVRSFTAALSAEVAGTGVTVTCFTPGVLRTPFFDREPMKQSRLMKILPRGNAAAAARVAWKGFKHGRSKVVPRHMDRFIINLCWMTPDWLLARLVLALQRAP
jgi:short-subunit dehydrogenase